MKTPLRLIPLDPDAIASIEVNIDAFAAERGLDLGEHATLIVSVARSLAAMPTPPMEDGEPWWGGYLALESETLRVVGTCAFKSPPLWDPLESTCRHASLSIL